MFIAIRYNTYILSHVHNKTGIHMVGNVKDRLRYSVPPTFLEFKPSEISFFFGSAVFCRPALLCIMFSLNCIIFMLVE